MGCSVLRQRRIPASLRRSMRRAGAFGGDPDQLHKKLAIANWQLAISSVL